MTYVWFAWSLFAWPVRKVVDVLKMIRIFSHGMKKKETPNRTSEKSKLVLPDFQWKTTTCEVCGCAFDYLSKRRPHTCRSGECRYKYHFNIDRRSWASYQPTLFDPPGGQ